ncbi:MAG TPA: apolipoprotein N-acyltransferase [Candidatus Limnocylindrales bacterium]|nr:apolipoprotein N-acyltransferase [Candidatus Limnocylindrales bacterium]
MSGSRNPSQSDEKTLALSRPIRLALACGSGLLLVTAFPSFHFHYAAWFSLTILMAASAGARPRFAALCGFLHGVAFFFPTLSWLYVTFRIHGGVTPVMSVVALGAIVVPASLFPMAFAWCFAWMLRRSLALACAAAPFLWVAQEFGRRSVPQIGFPWNLLGYAGAHNLVLAQLAALGGVWLLSFLVTAFNALLFWALMELRAGKRTPLLIAAGSAAALLLVAEFGERWVPVTPPDHVARLVQANFPEPDSFPPDWLDTHAGELDQLERMSLAPGPDGNPPGLLIWSEVPAPFSMQEPKFAARAQRIGKGVRDGFLVGVIDWKVAPGAGWHVYNGAVLLDPSGRQTFLYDKIHLVPFSEFVPWSRWFTFVKNITLDLGNFTPGTDYTVGTLPDGRRFGVFICYEAIFPDGVRQFVTNGAEVLVNISNDGWFGRSAGPEQHLDMARLRAVENRRWLVRCTNNGYTAVVDPYGRVKYLLPVDVRALTEAQYGYRNDLSLYDRWGDWVPWVSIFAGLGIMLWAGFLKRAQNWKWR